MLLNLFVEMTIVNLPCLFFVEGGRWWIQKILCINFFFQKNGAKIFKMVSRRSYSDINLNGLYCKNNSLRWKVSYTIFWIKKIIGKISYTFLNILIRVNALVIISITRSFIILKYLMENSSKSFANILLFLWDSGVRSWYIWPLEKDWNIVLFFNMILNIVKLLIAILQVKAGKTMIKESYSAR